MSVLITGAAGYIGSVVTEELVKDGQTVVVYDSLYKGHRQAVVQGADFVHADLMDTETLRDTPAQGRAETEALIAKWRGRGRLGYAVTPRFALTSSDAQLADA